MRIRDVLRKKGTDVYTVEPGESVPVLVDRLNERRIGALVVLGAGGEVAGIVTERDVLRNYGRCVGAEDDLPVRVADIMTTELIIGVPDDELQYAIRVMTRERIRHLPIIEDGKLAGIISIGDIVKAMMDEIEFENRMLKDYIQTS